MTREVLHELWSQISENSNNTMSLKIAFFPITLLAFDCKYRESDVQVPIEFHSSLTGSISSTGSSLLHFQQKFLLYLVKQIDWIEFQMFY